MCLQELCGNAYIMYFLTLILICPFCAWRNICLQCRVASKAMTSIAETAEAILQFLEAMKEKERDDLLSLAAARALGRYDEYSFILIADLNPHCRYKAPAYKLFPCCKLVCLLT